MELHLEISWTYTDYYYSSFTLKQCQMLAPCQKGLIGKQVSHRGAANGSVKNPETACRHHSLICLQFNEGQASAWINCGKPEKLQLG
jgi:hypothetical protein